MEALRVSFALDRRWHFLRGEVEGSKEVALRALVSALGEAGVPYAVIGGIALQVHRSEPRTTLDIDIAVLDRGALPIEALERAGFVRESTWAHSTNWRAADGTPVQITDDSRLRDAIARAQTYAAGPVGIRVLRVEDLMRSKLTALSDSGRRRSERAQDVADVLALIDDHPELEALLSDEERPAIGLG